METQSINGSVPAFTPGPWAADMNGDDETSFRAYDYLRGSVRDPDGNVIAYLPERGPEEMNPRLRADANILAAALDLYAVVKRFLDPRVGDIPRDIEAAERALAKAEGRAS